MVSTWHKFTNTTRLPQLLLLSSLVALVISTQVQGGGHRPDVPDAETRQRMFDALPIGDDEKVLKRLVMKLHKSKTRRVSMWDYQKVVKELKKKTPIEQAIISDFIAGRMPWETDAHEPLQEIEEIVVTWRPFEFLPENPAEFSVTDIGQMRGARMIANQWYRDGEYKRAYPLLLELAKRGFKDSQSRLAYILLYGADGVEKSNLRALGWLGAAAHGRTEPAFRVLFKRYYKQVPEQHLETVDRVVAAYQDAFSFSEYLNCSTDHRFSSGVVKTTYCQFKMEAIAEACRAGGGGSCWIDKVNMDVEQL